jgi:ethanolamine utilization cobalamin adenosyltransferase
LLRTQVREVELSACRAFGACLDPESQRGDIIQVLNRLSSAFYILTYKYLPEDYDKTIR